ncbi:alkaline phosphatase family protein [Jatrophihabitans sp. DSM 45814]
MTQNSDNLLNKPVSRRSVIVGAAAIAGALGMAGLLPERLAKAASAAPPSGGFDLSKVKHVVYLMQENRSFDHYFGTFPGVRGFDDPTAMTLANGNSVFQQPDPANPDGYLEPYHMDTTTTGAAAVPSLSHDWRDQHAAWNNGAMDGWLLTHVASDGDVKGSFTMGYMEQQDIPFHWALAEKFTLCDNYHCSVMGPTYPNRAVWMSGTNDPTGTQGGPILETVKPNVLQWKSAAEVLYNAGYTVKTYTSSGSYNYFSWWKSFATTGQVDTALYNRVMQNGTLFGDGKGGIGDPASPTAASTAYLGFEEDCANGTLADVTWLFPDGPYASDEHPPNTPAAGAYFLASKLEALAANEDLWNSTVFIINYDENDGFFDHVPPPVPDRTKYPDEYVTVPSPRGTPGGGLPSGSGFRVPCFIISPWTVGGHIYSQVADHTSPLQLIEAITAAGGLNGTPSTQAAGRTAVTFDAITPWRRATFDDLAGVFQDAALPAPTDAQFDQDTRQANYLAQLTASAQPMPPRPGAAQSLPHQDPVETPVSPSSPTSTPAAPAKPVAKATVTKVTTAVAKVPSTKATGSYKVSISVPSGHAVATGTVTITLKLGSTTHTATGNLSGGAATIPLGNLGKGTWAVAVSWPGDANYVAASATGTAVKVTK